jgi:hypothetical protein
VTASTIHTRHYAPPHPVRESIVDLRVWVTAWGSVGWAWALRQPVVGPALGWLAAHLHGVVVTAVALVFVTGIVVKLHLSDEDAWSILVALAGYPPIAGAVAYHIGGTS